ncbi:hypothetical protein AKO1_009730 [Acrasis kona]|uniref:THAP-type domain-containing protein n=1 Tax=Acrasis kona TaxID=1008807 RepID=A0AAW2ZMN4_9EUKA
MFTKKHFILHKARSEFEKRIEQGEDIQFNFSCKPTPVKSEFDAHQLSDIELSPSSYTPDTSAFKKRKISKYCDDSPTSETCGTSTKPALVPLEEERVLINYNNFFQVQSGSNAQHDMPIKPPSPAPEQITSTNQATKRRGGKRSNSNAGQTNPAQGVQGECCLTGCHNTVTNRLRFSLRCHKHEDFKQEFLDNGWNKVCHYHYFSDLYKYKKMTHGSAKAATGRKSKSVSPASSPEPCPLELDAVVSDNIPSTVLGKRARREDKDDEMECLQKATDQRLEDANVFVHFLMTTKQSPGGDL